MSGSRLSLYLLSALLLGAGIYVSSFQLIGPLCLLLSAIAFRTATKARPRDPSPLQRDNLDPLTEELRKLSRQHELLPAGLRRSGFLNALQQEIARGLPVPPRRFLVLGSHSEKTRASLSLQLAGHLSRENHTVRLVDFDLQNRPLSKKLNREDSPGVGDLLLFGGAPEEFYSSISEGPMEFAPAGMQPLIDHDIETKKISALLDTGGQRRVVIDSSTTAPLHLIVGQIDAVLYLDPGTAESEQASRESQILLAFREAGLPVWAISPQNADFFPIS